MAGLYGRDIFPPETEPGRGDFDDKAGTFDLIQVFPLGFLLICALLFAPPTVKCIDASFDPDFTYWNGEAAKVFSFLPLALVAVAHVRNVRHGAPSRLAVFVGLLGSAICLLVASLLLFEGGLATGHSFANPDCNTFVGKADLERSWQSARAFYAACLLEEGQSDIVLLAIEDCPGYMQHEDDAWRYLADLEQRHSCGGWCTPGPQLWGFGEVPGTQCSTAVGDMMLAKIRSTGRQLLAYSLAVVLLATGALYFWGAKLRGVGVEW